jgi:hypothetical protein
MNFGILFGSFVARIRAQDTKLPFALIANANSDRSEAAHANLGGDLSEYWNHDHIDYSRQHPCRWIEFILARSHRISVMQLVIRLGKLQHLDPTQGNTETPNHQILAG